MGQLTFADHGAGVQPHVHLHDGDAGFGIPCPDGTLDGRGTAPARQQGAVHVDAAQTRRIEHGLGQDQAIGHYHHQVGAEGSQFGLRRFIAQGGGLIDRKTVGQCQFLDRAGGELLAAAGRFVGLGVNGDDLVAGRQQRRQVTGGEVGVPAKISFSLFNGADPQRTLRSSRAIFSSF